MTHGPAPPADTEVTVQGAAGADGPHGGFRHQMMLYESAEEYVLGAADFLRAGLARGEAALVVVPRPKIDPLREALGDDAKDVRFEDMAEVGRNPARIIPAWRDFVDANLRPGRQVRGIGEPIFAERTPAELVECQLHEALLNLAFADASGFTLLCPYDASALAPGVIEEALRSHPIVCSEGGVAASDAYLGASPARFDADLPAPGPLRFSLAANTTADLKTLRTFVAAESAACGFDPRRSEALVLVVHEAAANSLVHGGGQAVVRCWQDGRALVVEVRDEGRFEVLERPLVGRTRPTYEQESGRGLWLANQLADLVQVRTLDEHGTVVRISMRRD